MTQVKINVAEMKNEKKNGLQSIDLKYYIGV